MFKQVRISVEDKDRHGRPTEVRSLDNVRPHTAAQTLQTIHNLDWKLLPHRLYSLDLVRSDFHLFGPLKDFTRVKKFESDDEVKSVVSDWLRHQSKEFWA